MKLGEWKEFDLRWLVVAFLIGFSFYWALRAMKAEMANLPYQIVQRLNQHQNLINSLSTRIQEMEKGKDQVKEKAKEE